MIRLLILSTLLAFTPAIASAAEIEVKMLNKGDKGVMVFQPDYVEAAPGDTVVFEPASAGHNAESVKGMLPDGVEAFKSGYGKPYRLTVAAEGIYGVKCTPHNGMGMVALVKVGKPVNLEAAGAVKHPGKAQAAFAGLLAQAVAAE